MKQFGSLVGLLASGVLGGVLAVPAAGADGPALAADPCGNFRWDMRREVGLFAAATTPRPRNAGRSPRDAPRLAPARLHTLNLQPRAAVRFLVPPAKDKAEPGAFGGLARIRVPADGIYRLALDVPFWVDLLDGDVQKIPLAFGGSPGCERPHKVLVFSLEQGRDYLLQLSGEPRSAVRLTLFAAEP